MGPADGPDCEAFPDVGVPPSVRLDVPLPAGAAGVCPLLFLSVDAVPALLTKSVTLRSRSASSVC